MVIKCCGKKYPGYSVHRYSIEDEKYLLKRGFLENWSNSRGILERTGI